jgi:peptidyl-prolyl cis-trans isomerase C
MNSQTEWMKFSMTALLCGGLVVAMGAGCKPKQAAPATPVVTAKTPAPAPGTAPETAPAVPALDPAMVLVTVGGDKLTVGEADKQILAMLGPQAAQLGADRMASLMGRFRQQAVDRFVVRTLLVKEADRRQVKVTESEIDLALSTIKKRLPEGMTLEEALQKEGLSLGELKTNLVGELRIKQLVESEVPTNAVVSDEEIAKFYEVQKEQFVTPESVEARHILVKVESTDDEKTKAGKKAKIEALHKQLVEGADFEKVAKENSDCPSKERGGNLGTFARGNMVKAFEDAAFSQPTNAIGPVVETMFGYHIIQVLNKKPAGVSSLADVKERLADSLKQRKQMESFDVFMKKLKAVAKIDYAAGFEPQPPMTEMPMAQPEE